MHRLLPLLLLVPALELIVLLQVGSRIGMLAIGGIIVGTAVLGATLARAQGLRVLRDIQCELAEGRMPTAPLIDGAIVLASGVLLLTPGLLSDVAGSFGLVPPLRAWLRQRIWRRLERAAEKRAHHVQTYVHSSEAPTLDTEYRSLE